MKILPYVMLLFLVVCNGYAGDLQVKNNTPKLVSVTLPDFNRTYDIAPDSTQSLSIETALFACTHRVLLRSGDVMTMSEINVPASEHYAPPTLLVSLANNVFKISVE